MTPRQASLAWVEQSLAEELREQIPAALEKLAETLVRIAEGFDIPVEELIAWIHSGSAKKGSWTPEVWTQHAKAYAALRDRLTRQRNEEAEGRLPRGFPE